MRQILLSVFLMTWGSLPVYSASAGELIVTVTGIQADGGEVGCALHAVADGFPTEPEGAVAQWQRAQRGSVVCRFADLAPGLYAVAVSHDLNGNRKTDTNLFGIPREPWGVSNNIRPGMRAPRFEEAAVPVTAGATLEIQVEVAK